MMTSPSMPMFGGDREAGFTLLETLIAFLVLSLSLGVFVQSIAMSASQIRSAQRLADAKRIAEIVLAREAGNEDAAGPTQGKDPATGLAWQIVRDDLSTANSGAASALSLLTIEVTGEKKNAHVLSVKTIELRQRTQ